MLKVPLREKKMTQERTPEQTLKDFHEAVAAGHRSIAWEMIQEVISRGFNYEHLQLEFVLPVLQEIAQHADTADNADFLRAQETLGFVIKRLRDSAPRKTSHTPVTLIIGTGRKAPHKRVEKTGGTLLCEMLSFNGWTASYIDTARNPEEIVGRIAATEAEVVVLLGFGPNASVLTPRILESISIDDLECRVVLCGPHFAGGQADYDNEKIIVLPDIRAAYLLLSAAGQHAEEELEKNCLLQTPDDYLAEALEASDTLFCTLSQDMTITSANRRCRDEFGMCQGESIKQYLEPGSAEIFSAMTRSTVLSSETVEITLIKHGESYLVDALLIPCVNKIALLAHPRQEEIEKLTAILTNYNKEINSLNCKLHKAEATILSQQHAIESAYTELKQAYETLKSLEWHDPLTGTYNKHYYELILIKEVNRAKRYGRHLSFLMIDVDNFRAINGEIGHPAGDAVLKHIVKTISEHTRADIDWLARIGPDEFVLVLPETDMQGCMIVGEKLLTGISTTPLSFEEHLIPITVSAGGATYDPSQTIHLSYKELPRQADAALSSAQKKGPNTVFISRLD